MIADTNFTDMITANKAVAIAVVRAKPKVIAAYPICPQTEIVEYIAEFVSQGDLKAEYVRVESENSAITIVAAAEPV